MENLIKPYGGALCNTLVDETRAEKLKSESGDFQSITLNLRQICDLELLLNGGFSPLCGFMNRDAYESVVEDWCLPDGTLWSLPIVLDVPGKQAESFEPGQQLALRDGEGFMLAVLTVEDIWQPDKDREASEIYASRNLKHPGVGYLYEQVHDTYIGGTIEGIQLPTHFDFETLRDTPEELRHLFTKMGWQNVVGFHTCKPMHKLHREITLQAAKEVQANILLHPSVGMTKPGDLHYYARVHCYQAIRRHYPHNMAALSLLPSAVRMAGPREVIMNAIIRQNYGCSHMIVGPHHASPPGTTASGERFYPRYASREMMERHQDRLEIQMVPIREMSYSTTQEMFRPVEQLEEEDKQGVMFTDRDLRYNLEHNLEIPHWYSYPEVISELRKVFPPRNQKGLTLFFTGLSGSGKSTLAKIMYAKFIEEGHRPTTLLDGDVVRINLSSELGFSKEHRNINVRRIGFVASEITKNGGIAICAPIAPYTAMRRDVRRLIEQRGAFIEIHVATSLEVCESRDRKGLYAKARKGIIPEFTGISDPYEEPENPELRIDTENKTPMQAAQEIMLYLLKEGYLDSDEVQDDE
ncbi:MAG: bifunctional sulfate adenylyltransferase/adenylylsulfate kinase [Gammaproteobacteria bacterium]|nr:MAG: bifunctional sulfate adenylyltransferase/adenylylsulfate kinase [Gammaproteobacteria bacterium]